jgi:hypothetical protein
VPVSCTEAFEVEQGEGDEGGGAFKGATAHRQRGGVLLETLSQGQKVRRMSLVHGIAHAGKTDDQGIRQESMISVFFFDKTTSQPGVTNIYAYLPVPTSL